MSEFLVTCWYRDLGNGFEFNHISSGFNPGHDEPPYVTEQQGKNWCDGLWLPKKAVIRDGVVYE